MKKYSILTIIMVALIAIVYTGCENAEYDIKDNNIYISEAVTSDSKTLTMEGGVDISINVRLAKIVDYDVEVRLEINPELLNAYNEANATDYHSVPNLELADGGKVIIPAGEVGVLYTFRIEDFEMVGKRYGLGIELIETTSKSLKLSETLSDFVCLLSKPLITSVPVMKGISSGDSGLRTIRANPATDWGITTNEWSLEAWIRMSGYNINNQAIFNTGSKDHEIYIRFGDANGPFNYLQIKSLGGQVDTEKDLLPNQWYHWAFVYDGSTLKVYRNGELDKQFEPSAPKGGAVRFDYFHMIASTATYFKDECSVSQVRLWNKAISQDQIKNSMHFAIDPTNPALIGYWPMGEGQGSSFADATGNGHDAAADSENLILRWEHNIRFDK